MLPLTVATMLAPQVVGGAGALASNPGLFEAAKSMFGPASSMLGPASKLLEKPSSSETVTAISGLEQTGSMTVTQSIGGSGSVWILVVGLGALLVLTMKKKR